MLVIARTNKGKEFLYDASTARAVSKASAARILKVVNDYQFLLDPAKNQIWHIYEVSEIDTAYQYAQFQKFTIRNGIVTARNI